MAVASPLLCLQYSNFVDAKAICEARLLSLNHARFCHLHRFYVSRLLRLQLGQCSSGDLHRLHRYEFCIAFRKRHSPESRAQHFLDLLLLQEEKKEKKKEKENEKKRRDDGGATRVKAATTWWQWWWAERKG
ncbi:hypothetical protein PIB30_029003 [Stylosanthes scabra]|uniref:Uncharacterized protein n=1 Tax=Stylosanthes scabra TaxID=79078 RepID=A0ABU6XCW7_9FABA|nr:hypothetical protein [Stylosanthes scabra]